MGSIRDIMFECDLPPLPPADIMSGNNEQRSAAINGGYICSTQSREPEYDATFIASHRSAVVIIETRITVVSFSGQL